MSDTPSWPDWSPDEPGDVPPPPPPPGGVLTDGGAPTPPSWNSGAGGWTPPPPPTTRPSWLVPVIVAAIVVGVGLLGVAAALVARTSDGGVPDETRGVATATETPDGRAATEDGVPGVDGPAVVTAADAVTKELLTAIDESEVTMITFQVESRDGVDETGVLLDGGVILVTDAATRGLEGLGALRERMMGLEDIDPDAVTPGLLAIRDGYVDHLEAWQAWMGAVRDNPTLLQDDNEDGAPFNADIASTADVFVDELRIGLPSDTSLSLREYAQFIIDRGFGGSGDGGDLV